METAEESAKDEKPEVPKLKITHEEFQAKTADAFNSLFEEINVNERLPLFFLQI